MERNGTLLGVQCAVIPRKMSCIRWAPVPYNEPKSFVTSSWGSAQNSVAVWSQFHDNFEENENDAFPRVLAEQYLPGDIIGLEFIDEASIACATSEGSVSILKLNPDLDLDNLTNQKTLKNVHSFGGLKAACTALSVHERKVATVGEDGCLKITSVELGKVTRTIEDRNYCTLGCVSFVSTASVIVSSRYGIIHCYDMREPSDQPVFTLSTVMENEKQTRDTNCLSYPPNQCHITIVGLDNGNIMGWDLRMPKVFSTHFKAHDSGINDISFWKYDSKVMFSASEDGEISKWVLGESSYVQNYFEKWIHSYETVVKETKSLNSIDASSSHLICSGDNALVLVMEIPEDINQ